MTTTVLAYFPSPPRGVWHLGPVPIRAYALCIIIGIVVALLIGDRRWEARGGERGVIYDIALWAVPFGLIGGRLYHLATDWRTYFGESGAGLGAAIRIWDGGLGIWGAVALGGLGAWIGCRRRGIPLAAFADAVAPGIVLAQAIGRLGNYFNQELFGRETTVPWGLKIFYRRDPAGFVDVHSLDGVSTGQLALVVQPTFLYELLWNVAVFVALIYLDRYLTIGHGRLFALYVAGYCVGRFCIELLRDDTATHIAGIRINSFTSTFVFIGAVVYLILAPKGREDQAMVGEVATEEPVPEPATDLVAVASSSSAASTAKGDAAGDEAQETAARAVDTPDGATEAAAAEAETAAAATAEGQAVTAPAEAMTERPPKARGSEVKEPEVKEPEAAAVVSEPEKSAADFEDAEAQAQDSATADAEAEAEQPDAESPAVEKLEVEDAGAVAKSADDEVEAAEEAAAELTGGAPTPWRSRLRRLNPRSWRS
jgi:prolipoprotein diacylglyceryl transferase